MTSTSPIGFFEQAKLASLHKLGLLGRYLTPLVRKIGSSYERIWVIDGFAGAGAYGPEGKKAIDGSPLIAAKFARQVQMERKKELLQVIAIEGDDDVFTELRRNLAPYQNVATPMKGKFEERIDEVLAMIGDDPAFFFLDPFGVAGIEMELVEKLIKREGKTELFIHLSDRSIKRMAGHLEEGDRTPIGQLCGESKLQRLDALFGTKMWRPIGNDAARTWDERAEALASLYLSQLRTRGISYCFDIPMRDEWDDRPKYRLVFGTRSLHGVEMMSDPVCRYERQLRDAYRAGQLDMFAEQQMNEDLGKLKSDIHALGLSLGTATRQEVVHGLVAGRFGQFLNREYDGAIRDLVSDGGIDRPTPSGIKPTEPLRFTELAQTSLFG